MLFPAQLPMLDGVIFEINAVQVATHSAQAFETAFANAITILRSAQGCNSVELLRCIERPGWYLVKVGWNNIADHVEIYSASGQARSVRAILRPFIEKAEMLHYETAAE